MSSQTVRFHDADAPANEKGTGEYFSLKAMLRRTGTLIIEIHTILSEASKQTMDKRTGERVDE